MRSLLFCLAGCFLLIAGCNPRPSGGPLDHSSWKLSLIGETDSVPDSTQIILHFEEHQISGNSGCNNFFGDYVVEGGSLQVKGLGATRMVCPENMELEKQFLDWLESVNKYSVRRNELKVTTEKGGVLYFTRLSEAETAAMETQQAWSRLDRLFASDLPQEDLHLYAVSYPNEVADYPYHGTEIPYDLYLFFGEELTESWQDLGWGVYAIGKYHGYYLLRIPGRYTSDQIALYEAENQQMVHRASLASKWCDEGWCNQQDAWLQDLNADHRFDIITHYAQLDEQGEAIVESMEVKLQTVTGDFVKTNELNVEPEAYPLVKENLTVDR